MTLEFHELALEEYDDHLGYYQKIDPSLTIRFQNEIERLLRLIRSNPLIFRDRIRGYRRANLNVFNHYLIYLIRADSLYVVAIGHGSQQAEYWLDRLDSP